jgi:hypothetical protein
MTEFAFSPVAATTKSITAASVTSAVALPALDVEPNRRTVRVYNSTNVIVFIAFGTSAVTALVTGLPIPPGAVETFEVPGTFTHVAGITAAGGGTVYFTEGVGNS